MNNIKDKLLKPSKETYEERFGKSISYISIGIIIALVLLILYFIVSKGVSTFTSNHINLWQFLSGMDWNPGKTNAQGQPAVGALPMIVTSFSITLLSALVAAPFSIAISIFVVVMAPKKVQNFLRNIIELLVGIPSVVYGFIGLTLIIPFVRNIYGGTGFGLLSGTIVLFIMVLPTVTSMTIDSLSSVSKAQIRASYSLGATRWQTIYKVMLRAATPGILTAVIFGMARAFGEALAVQMVIGNSVSMPTGLLSPSSTLTSQLTTGIGNTVMGTLPNNALWSLALVLLLMSLIFNIIVKLIGRKGRIK